MTLSYEELEKSYNTCTEGEMKPSYMVYNGLIYIRRNNGEVFTYPLNLKDWEVYVPK